MMRAMVLAVVLVGCGRESLPSCVGDELICEDRTAVACVDGGMESVVRYDCGPAFELRASWAHGAFTGVCTMPAEPCPPKS